MIATAPATAAVCQGNEAMTRVASSKQESVWFTGRSALITALIAIALNPIYIIIGYYISQTLQAPKLEISYADIDYDVAPLKPNTKLLSVWNKDPYFKDFMNQQMQFQSPTCQGWFSETAIRPSCLNDAARVARPTLEQRKFDKEKLEADLQRISDSPDGSRPSPSSSLYGLPRCINLVAYNKQDCLSDIRTTIGDLNNMIDVLDSFAKALDELLDQPTQRTGRVKLTVGILNRGDSDSVIPATADLTTEGKTLVMRRATIHPGIDAPAVSPLYNAPGLVENSGLSPRRFTPVKARGFSEIVFEVDESMSIGKNKDHVFSAIKNKSHAPFTLLIKTQEKALSYVGDFTG
jgi:hypothetical protein